MNHKFFFCVGILELIMIIFQGIFNGCNGEGSGPLGLQQTIDKSDKIYTRTLWASTNHRQIGLNLQSTPGLLGLLHRSPPMNFKKFV